MSLYDDALEYHSKGRKGKIEVVPTKPVATQQDLSLAYSPGVAGPCLAIAEKKDLVYEYTAKGNLVAVVTNGSAVLGLGGIGPEAAKPVMEGKGVLFKKFADIDVFDIELRTRNPDDVIRACEMLEPTFGGINLEDIKAPECFYIEEELKKRLKIPVFHDDQHGTAVISGAALLNAVALTGRKMEDLKIVCIGGGAASIACANLYLNLGVRPENMLMTDTSGVIYKGRTEGMNPYKEKFARVTEKRTLVEALDGADCLVGCSAKGAVTADMILKMAKNPIIFAMANPDPEIGPEVVMEVRPDALIATGRSDYPNQVNNVLGFPFIFRGALDTYASAINEEMKMAAVRALADLAKQDIPEGVLRAYGGAKLKYGKDYLIPKPFDRRALIWVASAVAEAAMKSGVARTQLDIPKYKEHLESLLGATYTVMRGIKNRVRKLKTSDDQQLAQIVFPEGTQPKIIKAVKTICDENIATPILIGDFKKIQKQIDSLGFTEALKGVKMISPADASSNREEYALEFLQRRCRKGVTLPLARALLKTPNYYGAMMVEKDHADALISGVSQSYSDTIKPALEIVGVKKGSKLSGIYMILTKKKLFWFADTTVNIDPTAADLADIAIQTADFAESFTGAEAKVAMLSFSNFGSNRHPFALKIKEATNLAKGKRPDLKIDGEMQADIAFVPELSEENFPFNQVKGDANVIIFPDLQSGNIAYKMMSRIGGAEKVGPILVGMKKPVFVLERGCDVSDIVNMAAIAAMEVMARQKQGLKK